MDWDLISKFITSKPLIEPENGRKIRSMVFPLTRSDNNLHVHTADRFLNALLAWERATLNNSPDADKAHKALKQEFTALQNLIEDKQPDLISPI